MGNINTINIANGTTGETVAFAIDSYGEVMWLHEAMREQEAGYTTIVAHILDDAHFPGTHDDWLASVRARYLVAIVAVTAASPQDAGR